MMKQLALVGLLGAHTPHTDYYLLIKPHSQINRKAAVTNSSTVIPIPLSENTNLFQGLDIHSLGWGFEKLEITRLHRHQGTV